MYSLICVLAVFLLSIFLDIPPVIFVLLSAVCGILIKTAEVRSK